MDVLRSLPCLAAAPEELLLWIRAYGELRSFQPGQCIIPRRVRNALTFAARADISEACCLLVANELFDLGARLVFAGCDARSTNRPLQVIDDM